ncbi:MAG: 23S rRNA (pseudouridine(1915)-N(3))-methyltransferase RlmH [Gemmatimonadetes bacterium]|nr:23S rRNA (pseudouridine(1915)-N(3))-methyltransferase RlmH [Gemmatimonadota bacterium]
MVVGRVRGSLEGPVSEYEERARRYWKLEVTEVDAGAPGRNPEPRRVMAAEGERILGKVATGLELVALTRVGTGMDSRTFTGWLEGQAVSAAPGVAFVLGGAFGLDPAVLSRASRRFSLSPMTLPHELARLVLAEQLYRAGTILRGEPYHKGD